LEVQRRLSSLEEQMERSETSVRTLGKIRIEILDSPVVLSLKLIGDPDRELVPGILQPTERRWLAGMLREVLNAYDRFAHEPRMSIHLPDRTDLALPKPESLHPVDHFGRAWNVFMHAAEMMGATVFFCDEEGREVRSDHRRVLPHHSVCLRFG
jgi:hypothetical protein